MIRFLGVAGVVLGIAASVVPNDAGAVNVILNGGFEGGVHSNGGNPSVPNGWTSSAGFDAFPLFNQVVTAAPLVHSGNSALQIGNASNQTLASISQSFLDVAGGLYTVSFWVFVPSQAPVGANQLTVFVNSSGLTLNNYVAPYTQQSFTFVGTGGLDTLTISGFNNSTFFYVDDVSVGPAPTPLPPTWTMMLIGLAGVGFITYRRSNGGSRTIAAA